MKTSEIYKQVEAELLAESNQYSFVFIDGVSGERLKVNNKETLEKYVEVKNPFGFDPSGLLPNFDIMDLERFFQIASEVIGEAQEREGILETAKIQFREEYHPEDMALIGNEVITFKVLKREPAKMNTKATGRPQRQAGFAYQYREAKDPNKIIVVESRPIDHEIEFSIWATTATMANKRALWLERLFINHRWAFAVQGVERFVWLARGPDVLWKPGEQRLHQRALKFFVRLREFEVSAYPAIKSFTIEISNDY